MVPGPEVTGTSRPKPTRLLLAGCPRDAEIPKLRKPKMHRERLWADTLDMFDVRRKVFYPKISLYTKRLNQTQREELLFPG